VTASQTSRILDLASRLRMIRAADVAVHGWSPQLLLKLHKQGRLLRIGRGLYGPLEFETHEHQSLIEACAQVPKGVVCLLSALHFHGLGTQVPHEVWLALPSGSRTPPLSYPPLHVVRLRGDAHGQGIESFSEGGTTIRVYGVAKTLADCFKFRNQIGLDVALEALKDAWRGRRFTMDEMNRFARVARVERVMRPYLEALVA